MQSKTLHDEKLLEQQSDIAIVLNDNDLEAQEIIRLADGRAQCVVLDGVCVAACNHRV